MEHSFDRIIGYGAVKRDLAYIADALRDGAPCAALGAVPPRGLLLYGPPGVGKTLMADCLIRASGRRVFLCRRDRPDGEFIPAIAAVFAEAAAWAAAHAPAIVFLDDLDKFSAEDEARQNEPEYTAVQAGIDSLQGSDVFVLATANDLSPLPESLTRRGRFDRVIRVDVPEKEDAAAIFERCLADKPLADDVDRDVIARLLTGSSCAALECAVNTAALLAAHDRQKRIGMRHLLHGCIATVHNIPPAMLRAFPDVDPDDPADPAALAAWHEAGHAAVRELLDPGSVTLAVVHEKWESSRGFVTGTRCDDPRRADLIAAVGALGGRAAVAAQFGFADPGAQQDLTQAADALRDMLTDQGARGFSCLDLPLERSNAACERMEQSVTTELERCRALSLRIVTENRDFLRAVAAALLERGVLTSADIARLRESCRVVPLQIA